MSDPSPRTFLVVDDSPTMRRIIRATLGKFGYTNITEAGTGLEALQKAKAGTYDCVLTDWNLPDFDGLQLTQKLRQMPAYQHTPIVMITTEQAKEDVIHAMQRGINAYIIKPFTPEILKAKLDSLLPP